MGLVRQSGLDPLVEVHSPEEMQVALDVGADIIGINNRNLKTFEVSLDTTEAAAAMAGDVRLLISESGIKTPEDVLRVKDAGCGAVLVGEQLLRQPDPGQALTELMGAAWASS